MREIFKTVRLKLATWKRLSMIRIERDFETMDDLIDSLIEYKYGEY